eukprot:CAMPEP_0198204568 /NCGR_PEP_ID=MMETSP1445-20131203/7982_1 /TAXON_ID=36898 /ORGANISM="Pyramimonas sp., Strain CCMP2087" /LENGTH=141 /DNA_ID=CAMNT_0043876497 /DNA_START=88 /DNA_END=510 /DNA_ORIENTATION=-
MPSSIEKTPLAARSSAVKSTPSLKSFPFTGVDSTCPSWSYDMPSITFTGSNSSLLAISSWMPKPMGLNDMSSVPLHGTISSVKGALFEQYVMSSNPKASVMMGGIAGQPAIPHLTFAKSFSPFAFRVFSGSNTGEVMMFRP